MSKDNNNTKPIEKTISFDSDDMDFKVPEAPKASRPAAAPNGQEEKLFFISMGSGSSGNCSYLGTSQGGIIIDAGVDHDEVFRTLTHNGIKPSMVKGVILTHDHQDHVRYVYRIARTYKHIRVYCTPRLLGGLLRRHNISRRIKDYHDPIYKEIPFKIGNFKITAFETSHDGTDNMGFNIEVNGRHFVIATDMGKITERAEAHMKEANFLIIESNYDRQMLDTGRYPEYLKNRVRSECGHLDNVVAAEFVANNYHKGLKNVFLCHLSNDNNTPEKARQAMTEALEARGLTVGDGSNAVDQRDRDIQVYVLPRYDASLWFVL